MGYFEICVGALLPKILILLSPPLNCLSSRYHGCCSPFHREPPCLLHFCLWGLGDSAWIWLNIFCPHLRMWMLHMAWLVNVIISVQGMCELDLEAREKKNIGNDATRNRTLFPSGRHRCLLRTLPTSQPNIKRYISTDFQMSIRLFGTMYNSSILFAVRWGGRVTEMPL